MLKILVVELNVSVADPLAAEGLAGTSLAPFKVAKNVMFGLGVGVGSLLLLQEIKPRKSKANAEIVRNFFIKND